MRVFQVVYSFAIGGSEVVASNIAQNMDDGIVHGVAALEFDGPLREKLEQAGVQTWVINRQPNERLSPMVRLWQAMRQFKPDVVHTHHLYQLFYTVAGAKLLGAQIVHTEHEYYSLMQRNSSPLLKKLSSLCRFVTGVNEETTDFLRGQVGIPESKLRTIVNGINLDRYRGSKNDGPPPGGVYMMDGDLVVGVVARLDPVKDHATLFRAFHKIVAKMPHARLWVIGDGDTRSQLEQMVRDLELIDNTRFFGIRLDIPELLSCLDVLVLPSVNEGLPISILEGMAAGKPVVATDVGGVATVVRPGETGLLVPAGDSGAMASAILTLLEDREKGEQMGKNGRRLVELNYNLEDTIAGYLALYRGDK